MNDEEWQGVTRDLFRAWLTKSGWKELETVRPGSAKWSHWTGTCLGTISDGRLAASIECVALHYRRSVHSILVEINPRMRKGIPSAAEIEAHRSRPGSQPWLARDEHGNQRVGWWTKPHWAQQTTDPYTFYVQGRGHLPVDRVKDWSFWPADRDLNKLPAYPLPARSGEGE